MSNGFLSFYIYMCVCVHASDERIFGLEAAIRNLILLQSGPKRGNEEMVLAILTIAGVFDALHFSFLFRLLYNILFAYLLTVHALENTI